MIPLLLAAMAISPLDAKWESYAPGLEPGDLSAPPIYREHTLRRPGDCDNDGDLDFQDIDPFVEALTADTDNWQLYWYRRNLGGNPLNLDLNWDGNLTFADVDPFVVLLTDPHRYWDTYDSLFIDHLEDYLGIGFVTAAEVQKAIDYMESTT